MISRREINLSERENKDKKVIKDYSKRAEEGFLYTVREVSIKNHVSLPQVYIILRRNNVEVR